MNTVPRKQLDDVHSLRSVARIRGLGKVPYEEMISTEDIVEAALLPFRMTSKACPTRIVIQNTFAV